VRIYGKEVVIMTTKEICLEVLKVNEFFQSAMKNGKMVLMGNKVRFIVIPCDMLL
jgi:hypothetical protein